jgi:ATP-binding cassette subfamily B protein
VSQLVTAASGGDPTTSEKLSSATASVTNGRLLRWMFRFLAPVKGQAALACFLLVAVIYVEIYTLKLTGDIVNHIKHIGDTGGAQAVGVGFFQWAFGSTYPDAVRLRNLILLLVGLVAAMAIGRYLREVQVMKFSMAMVFGLRESVYDKLQRVGFGFHDSISSGQLINRALSDLQNVRAFIQSAVLLTLEIILVVIGNIVLILTKSPWLALLAIVPLPIWTIYILRFSKKIQPAAKAMLEAEDKAIQIVTENVAGVHVIKAFATQNHEIEKYEKATETFRQRVIDRLVMVANFQPIIRSIASASHLSLFLLAGILIILAKGKDASLNVGDLLILGGAMGAILGRLQQVSTINEQYQNAIVSARRLHEVIDAPPTVPQSPAAVPLPPGGTGKIEFRNVDFAYAVGRPVLHDLTFTIPGGKVVAIVGPTGAGKTSLVNLVSRFYDPAQGRILIDDVDLRDLTLTSLRSQVSFVFQETYLFSDSVSANIAYGRPNITHGEIEAAARLAQAHEFIEALPQGYDTQLGERGTNLSGGQRQRLAIARAIVTNPRVLILDDATAAVDSETEDLIRRGMRLTLGGRTILIIAHRISTVKTADLVIVVEQGRVTQMGTHNELMQQDGHYREIAAAQLSRDDDEETETDRMPSHMDRIRDKRHVQDAKPAAQPTSQRRMEEAP